MLNSRLSHETTAKKRFGEAVRQISQPGFRTVAFDTGGQAAAHMKAAFKPGDAHVVLIGADVPDPAEGDVYRLWLGDQGHFRSVRAFLPEEGLVVLPFVIDLSRYDQILVTEEPGNEAPSQPSGKRRWFATLRPAA